MRIHPAPERAPRARSSSTRAHRPGPLAEILEQRIAPAAFSWAAPGGGAWESSSNWTIANGTDIDGVPDADDDVTIDTVQAGSAITVSTARAAQKITMTGDDTLHLAGGSLTITNASTINAFNVTSGSLVANATLTLTGNSTMSGGTLTGAFLNQGTFSLTGSAGKDLLNAALSNSGTIQVQGPNFDINNSTVNNLAGGLFDIQTDSNALRQFGSTAVLNNSGTVRKSEGLGTANIGNVDFNNAAGGVVAVTSGTLSLTGGGTSAGGVFNVSAGAVLDVTAGSTHTWSGTFSGSGAGIVRQSSGQIIAGTGGFTLNFPAGLFEVTDGSMSGAPINNTGFLTMQGGSGKGLIDATLNNSGTITVTGPNFDINNSTINNLVGGVIDIKTDSNALRQFGAMAILNNSGTVRKTGGSGEANLGAVDFNNAAGGVVEVTTGTLSLTGGGTNAGGTFNISAGAVLDVTAGAAHIWGGSYTGSGSGIVRATSGSITAGANGLTLNFPANFFEITNSQLIGAGITNSGFIKAAGGSGKGLIDATLNNAGTITVTGPNFDINNSTLNNLSSGVIDIQTDSNAMRQFGAIAVLNNSGTVRKSAGLGGANIGAVDFNNAAGGVIQVTAGSLSLTGGGTNAGGTFNVSAGSVLDVTAGAAHTWTGAYSGSGAGLVRASSGGITAGAGGFTINFPAGYFEITDSALSGSPILNNGFLTMAGSGGKGLINATLSNAGTITVTGPNFDINNSTINNLSTGVIDIQTDSNAMRQFGATAILNNSGMVRKTGGPGGANIGSVDFNNAAGGIIEVTSGSLTLSGGGTSQGGTFNVSAGAALNLTGGSSHTWTGAYTGSGGGIVALSGGEIVAGASGVILDFPANYFEFSNGALRGGTVTNTGFIKVIGGNSKGLTDATLNNAGTITITGPNFDLNNSTLNNLAGGLVDIQTDSNAMRQFGSLAAFNNSGTVLKSAGGGTANLGNVDFNNAAAGVVEVTSGALSLSGGGTSQGGTFNVSAGSVLDVTGGSTHTWSGTFSGSGAGIVRQPGGQIAAGAAGLTLNFPAGLFEVTDGSMTGASITNAGFLTMAGGSGKGLINATFNNAGTITVTGPNFDINNSTLNNLASGVIDIRTDSNALRKFGSTALLNNAGILQKTAGAGAANLGSVGLSNTGTVEVVSGTLSLSGPLTQLTGPANAATLGGGTWIVRGGAALDLSATGIATNSGAIQIEGSGVFSELSALATNNGSLTLRGGADLTRNGVFTNNGELSLGPGSTLSALSFAQTAAGAVTFQVAGVAAADVGRLSITGAATLAGSARAEVAGGFEPGVGDSFTLMTFGSRSGDFAAFDGLRLGRGLAFERIFDPAALRLNSLVSAADLDVLSITAPASGIAGQTLAFSYTVQNTSLFATTAPSWVDSVYLSLDGVIDPSDKLITRITHTGPVMAGGSYTENVSVTLPGALPGDYRILVLADSRGLQADPDRENNLLVSTGSVAVDIPTLTDGAALNSTIANGQDLWFRITIPKDKTPTVQVTSTVAGVAELYTRLSEVPTRAVFDASDFGVADLTQQVVQPAGAAGTYFVLLHGREAAGAGQSFTLLADALDLGVTGLSTNSGANIGSVTTRVDGSLFSRSTTFSLVPSGGGAPVPASAVIFQSATTSFATFNLAGLAPGNYNVVATDGLLTDTLLNGFTVVAGQVREQFSNVSAGATTEGQLRFDVSSPSFIRPPFRGVSATITYENIGGTDIPAPLFEVISANAKMRLADQTGFTTGVLELLGVNPNGFAGTLPPGARGTIEVIFEPINGAAGQNVRFEVFPVRAESDLPIDWDQVKESLQPVEVPDATWDVIFDNFKAGVGDDFGGYHQMLVENANYLSQFGKVSPDTMRLLHFELVQADDFGGISDRTQVSSLGRGQTEPFSTTLATDALGNVSITTGEETRLFVKEGTTNTFRAAAGGLGKVTLAGGAYTLDEGDGNKVVFRADGRINFTEDANGRRFTAAYDSSGRIDTLTDSFTGDISDYNYTGTKLTSVTDAVGRLTTYGYTGDNLTSVTTPLGTTTFTYITGQGAARENALATTTTPDGVTTTFTYDARGRLATKTIGSGAQAVAYEYTYDAAGHMLEEDAAGNITQIFRSPSGDITRVVAPGGPVSTTTHDLGGRVTGVVDSAGQALKLTYDAQGELHKVIDGLRGETVLDIGGPLRRLLSVTDPGGDKTSFGYDVDGNLKSVALPGTPEGIADVRYDYDAKGRIEASYDASGRRTGFTYDSKDLLQRTDLPDGTSVTYTYDSHRNLKTAADSEGTTTFTYDGADRVTSIAYPNGKTVTLEYDAFGRRSVVKDGTGFEVRYSYDTLGRLETVRDQTNAVLVDYDYDARGYLVKETRGNGATTTYTHDTAGRIDTITHRNAANAVTDSFDYGYDARGRIQTVATPGGTSTYGYDANDQLISATLPGGRVLTFSYDAEGNRITTSDSASGTENYSTSVRDQYNSAGGATFTYDADGRLATRTEGGVTTTHTYDSQGRLVAVTSPGKVIIYDYDALGYRIATTENGVRTDFAYDPAAGGTLFGEYGSSGATAHYASGIGIAARVAGGSAEFYHFDAIGNTALVSGAAGAALATYDYLPFGGIASQTGSLANPFTFNGRDGVQDDAGDLYFMRARYFDADTGRFISRDPIGLKAGDTNLYRFANNDPINLNDPTGLLIPTVGAGGASTAVPTATGSFVNGLRVTGLSSGLQAGSGAVTGGGTTGAIIFGESTGGYAITSSTGSVLGSPITTSGSGQLVARSGGVLRVFSPLQTLGRVAGPVAGAATLGYAGGTYIEQNLSDESRYYLQAALNSDVGLGPNDVSALYGGPNFGEGALDRYRQQVMRDPLFEGLFKTLKGNGYEPDEAFDRAAELLKNYRREHPLDQPEDETTSTTIRPGDPNNIVGPRGFGADPVPTVPAPGQIRFDGFVNGEGNYGYTILFENMPTATAPAQVVTVTSQLDADLNFSSFEWATFGWGDFKVTVPDEHGTPTSFHTQVDATAELGVMVNVDAELNPLTGLITVAFTSIDPLTGDVPIDPFAGFLPPNLTAPEGDGFITYRIAPKSGLANGTKFDAKATIIFDTEDPLDTPDVHNTLDAIAPSSAVTAFANATTSRTVFRVDWTASDDANGSGLSGTTILFTDTVNGIESELQSLTSNNASSAARFVGEVGHTYKFFSVASDNVGNTEAIAGNTPDATITVVPPTLVPVGKKLVFQDADGDTVTVTYSGKGSANLVYLDPLAGDDREGSIDQIFIAGSDTKSKLAITVKQNKLDGPDADTLPDGNGIVQIGDVTVTGSLGSFTATKGDLIVDGFSATGTVKTIAVRDMLRADPLLIDPTKGATNITLGGAVTDKTAITARHLADGIEITTPGTLSAITAASIGDGVIRANALSKLTTTVGAMNADLDIDSAAGAITVKGGVNAGIWSANTSFGAITVNGGSFAADLDTGKLTKLTVKGGDVSGDLRARSFGAVAITGGDFSGTILSNEPATLLGKTAALTSLTITGGDLAGDVSVLGKIGNVTVKADKLGAGGTLTGDLSARSLGKVSVTGGNLAGTITSLASLSDLGKTSALTGIAISGGDLTGDIRVRGNAGAISVLASKTGAGGNVTGASVVAAKIASLIVAKNLTNSLVLAGADLGADHAFGGGDDTFGAGSIGAVKIGTPRAAGTLVTNSVIAAGLLVGANGQPRGDDDTIFGATPGERLLNSIASLTISGQADAASYFAAGKFKAKPKIAGATVDPANDPLGRFFLG